MLHPEASSLHLPGKRLSYLHWRGSPYGGGGHDGHRPSPLYGVLFLNGLKSSGIGLKSSFLAELAAKSGAFDLFTFDYRGHGGSSGDFLELGVADWAEDARDMISHVAGCVGHLVLVGSSIGGWVACLLALRGWQPCGPRLHGMVLINPAVDASETFWNGLSAEEQQACLASGSISLKSPYLQPSEDRVGMSFFQQGRDNLLFDSSKGGSHTASCPVIILHGEEDVVVPVSTSFRLLLLLSGADSVPTAAEEGPRSAARCCSYKAGNVELKVVRGGDHRLSCPEHLVLLGDAVETILSWRHGSPAAAGGDAK